METKKSEYYAVILGALLHDIGKFVQRAQTNPMSQDHSRWGEEWFQNHLSEKLSKVFNERDKQLIRAAIGNHHEHEKIKIGVRSCNHAFCLVRYFYGEAFKN